MKTVWLLLLPVLIMAGCNTSKKTDESSTVQEDPSFTLTEMWRTDTVLKTCESVLFDENRNVLYVSCINGSSAEKDGDGYVSMLGPDGTIESLRWVTGLNDPKGMGVHENRLYVTDIDQLVVIDVENAEIIRQIPVEGASFLNDISVSENGDVYLSDSDMGILWIYSDGELTPWIREGLNRPNGLYVEEDRVLLASSGSQDLRVIDRSTGEMETVTTGIGAGDGVEYTGMEGFYITSSWTGEVFLIYPDYNKVSLLKTSDEDVNSADIGFNKEDQVLYVPTFHDNRVVAYKLSRTGDE
ncbi:MAG: hypothetical protein R6U78_00040 [Bacteroidales bacterium]